MESVHLQLSEELLARIDAERGMVARNRWIRWAVEQALRADLAVDEAAASMNPVRVRASEALAEQPSHSGPKDVYRGPEVEAEWRARSSVQARRDVRPVPKAKP